MDTMAFPLANTIIKLNDNDFQVDVVEGGVVKFSIHESTGLVGLSATATDFVITIPGRMLSFSTELEYDGTRSFEASQDAFAACEGGMIGVVDIRDMRCTYQWCLAECAITIGLGKDADGIKKITVYRASAGMPCFQELCV
jgi:hypothetical protein